MKDIKNKQKFSRVLCLALCAVTVFVAIFGVISVGAQDNKYEGLMLIPGGVPFGVKFSTEGVVVTGFCDIDGVKAAQNPAYTAGLRPKDVIIAIDGKKISDGAELTRLVEECRGREISLTYTRGGEEKVARLTPIYSSSEGKYKTGIWIRDHGAGIGTVTYILPESREFGGLGHGICDGESGELVKMSGGVVMDVKINSVKKGVSGDPGEIKGCFGIHRLGDLNCNTECGVFGKLTMLPAGLGSPIPVGKRSEVKCGGATLITTLSNGARREYSLDIVSVNKDVTGPKSFLIKITDPALIEASGGIVQGMSGSPIIQNGKLVGAVTHVMINDPTTGY